MSKNKIIISSVIGGLFLLLVSAFLLLPNFINLNNYTPQAVSEVKKQTGMDLAIGNAKFKTNLDLSISVFADDITLKYPDGESFFSLKNASVKLPLIPLAFKNIEIKAVKVNSPEINLVREKDGKYSIEKILASLPKSEGKQEFKLVNGIDVDVSNYLLSIDDKTPASPRKFELKGEKVKVKDFNPDKFVKIETSGKLLVQNQPNVSFDIKFATELPFPQGENTTKTQQTIDPLDSLAKYDFKSNIVADLKLKNVQKDMDIDGSFNFDGLSLKLSGQTLPHSKGQLDFKGKGVKINSDLYISSGSYISLAGDIKDIKKNKLDLKVKTSDINLADVKKFAEALSDVAPMDLTALHSLDLKGKLNADFTISDEKGYNGYLNVLNTNIAYKGISKPLLNLNCIVKFTNDKLVFENTYGYFDNNKFDINGSLDSKSNADIKFLVNSFNIKTILDLVNQSSELKKIKPQLKDIASLSGDIKIEAYVNGNLNKKISPEIKVSMINPAVVHRQVGFPVSLNKGSVTIKDDFASINGIRANVLSSAVYISGEVKELSSAAPKPDMQIKIPNFSIANIRQVANSSLVNKQTKSMIYGIKNPSGAVSADIKVLPSQEISAVANIKNISAYYAPSNLPVKIPNGKITTDGKVLSISNLKISPSTSALTINGTVKSLAKLPELDLQASGYLSAGDIKKYSPPETRKSIAVRGNIPVTASIAGYVDGWKLNSQINIDNLSYLANINASGNKYLKLNIQGKPSTLTFIDSGLTTSSGAKLVSITGGIKNYSSKTPVLSNLKVSMNNLGLTLVEPKGKLNLNGDITLSGSTLKPSMAGNISVKNISVPSMYLNTDRVSVALKSSDISINTGILNVLDSKFKIAMVMDNNFSKPVMTVKNINVSSSYMNADKLQKAFPPVPNQDLPVVVWKGSFSADKIVMNNLPITNTSCNFVINPMNIMKITNLSASTAGGKATGSVNMNLKNSRMSVDIDTQNMEINTLATAFANTPNEIYGSMNGGINISTYGYTPEQTLNNTKGTVTFTVTNGKLVKLGSLSHMLKAGNIISGGVGAQVIDNIVGFKAANNSNQFKKLTGKISLSGGVMNINELSSQGGDMSLFTTGYIRMSNNYGEITTLGTLSDSISSKLTRIPAFSAQKILNDKVISKMGQWGQLITEVQPKVIKPQTKYDISKIPPLSHGSNSTDRHFVVKIQGNIDKPSSVKSFKLID